MAHDGYNAFLFSVARLPHIGPVSLWNKPGGMSPGVRAEFLEGALMSPARLSWRDKHTIFSDGPKHTV